MKTPFQLFAEDLLHHILNNIEYTAVLTNQNDIQRQNGINDTIDYLVRHYPEFAHDGKKSYKDLIRYERYHKFSQRASTALAEAIINRTTPQQICKDVLYYEHFPPNSCLRNELLNRLAENGNHSITREEIGEIMEQAEVIIISKEEQNVLDSSTEKECFLDGELMYGLGMRTLCDTGQRFNGIGMTFCEAYRDNHITSQEAPIL